MALKKAAKTCKRNDRCKKQRTSTINQKLDFTKENYGYICASQRNSPAKKQRAVQKSSQVAVAEKRGLIKSHIQTCKTHEREIALMQEEVVVKTQLEQALLTIRC